MSSKRSVHKVRAHARHTTEAADPLTKLSVRAVSSPHGGYGWVRDLPDARDYLYSAPPAPISAGAADSGGFAARVPACL